MVQSKKIIVLKIISLLVLISISAAANAQKKSVEHTVPNVFLGSFVGSVRLDKTESVDPHPDRNPECPEHIKSILGTEPEVQIQQLKVSKSRMPFLDSTGSVIPVVKAKMNWNKFHVFNVPGLSPGKIKELILFPNSLRKNAVEISIPDRAEIECFRTESAYVNKIRGARMKLHMQYNRTYTCYAKETPALSSECGKEVYEGEVVKQMRK